MPARVAAHASLVVLLALSACGGGTSERPRRVPGATPTSAAVPAPARAEPAPGVETEVEAARALSRPAPRLSWSVEQAIGERVERAIQRAEVPGAVVAIGRADGIVFRRAYGLRQVEPTAAPLTEETHFDLASLTKPLTALLVLRWLEHRALATNAPHAPLHQHQGSPHAPLHRGSPHQGSPHPASPHVSLDAALDAPVDAVLPELAGRGISLRHLLTHRAGLRRVNPLRELEEGTREERLARTLASAPEHPPGDFRYGDLHFVALGAWLERASGERLDVLMARELFAPLGLSASFNPGPRDDVAPTERAPRRAAPGEPPPIIHGEVDDPRAWRLDGVAGHAGVFATADDLARLAEALLRREVLSPEGHEAMLARHGPRCLGWDCALGDGLSAEAYGHAGYTGTWLVVDPRQDLYLVLLTSRVHPDGNGRVGALRRELARIVTSAAGELAPRSDREVRLGVDVLRDEGLARLHGRRVALLTHDAGRAGDGLPTNELFWRAHVAGQLELVRLFAPEHGLASSAEGALSDGRWRDVPVTSLFGRVRSPPPATLRGVDVIVVDLQDVGARFFTYASTLHATLRAAAEAGVEVLVLDRPNPIGAALEGPMLEPAHRSFVNHHPLPVRHGLTLGELAMMLTAGLREAGASSNVDVLWMEGWRADMRWPDTGLRWTPPSPNLPGPHAVLLYPGVALIEGTNVSVGRGTETPFELLGAPWIDPVALRDALGEVEGLATEVVTFVPTARPHRGARCHGLALRVTDPARFRPVHFGLALAAALARTHPEPWETERLARMIGHDETTQAVVAGGPLPLGAAPLEAFRERSSGFWNYPRL